MAARDQYAPGPANMAHVQKHGDKWTLILVRELRHPPEKVWQAITDPAHLREWAPFAADGRLGAGGTGNGACGGARFAAAGAWGRVGPVNLTWLGAPTPLETKVTRADAPKLLEYGDTRWELEPAGGGTRRTRWHKIDRRFIAMGAAGWHIAFDVLDNLLNGTPIGRIAGA